MLNQKLNPLIENFSFQFWGIFFISGVFAALGQPDRGLLLCSMALLFGFSGIFYLLRNLKRKRFILAFSWAACVFGFQLSWLTTTHYHGISIVFVYFVVVSFFAFQFAILPIANQFSYLGGLVAASIWTLFEWSRLFILCGFPFSPIGLILTAEPVFMQAASIFGIYGLSFLVIFLSYLLAFSRLRSFSICLALLSIFGFCHMKFYGAKNIQEPYYHVALIQTGLSVEEKESIDVDEQWNRIFSYIESCKSKKFDLIVFPEVALIIGKKDLHLDFAKKLSRLYESEVVIGLIDKDYNAAFHVRPDRENSERYEKRVLVPVGEYLPFSFLRSFLQKYGITSFFDQGKECKVFSGKIPFAVSICFEEGFSNLIREGKGLGAELLVNLTNDGWFPNSRLPEEHFNLAKLRAIENGVYVLRACNTGVTGVIDPFGKVIDCMHEGSIGAQETLINCYSYPTIFSKFGNCLIVSLSFLCVLLNFLIKRDSFSRVLGKVMERFRRYFGIAMRS